MRVNPDQGLQFAQMLVQDEEPLANINQVNTHKRERLSHWRHPACVLPLKCMCLFTLIHARKRTKCPVWEPAYVLFQMWQQCQEFTESVTRSPL